MAITTLDGAIAGMQPPVDFQKAVTGTLVAGRPHNPMYMAGYPGAMAAPAPGIAGANLTSYAGQLPFTNPAGGLNTYLARFQAMATQAGTLILADRLWHNSGITITSTSEQPFTGVAGTPPARDMDGTTNGRGVQIGVEVGSATGAGTPNIAVKYVNSAGTSGQTVSPAGQLQATVASSIAGTFHPIALQAGDVGCRMPQSITLSATWTSGSIHVVMYRVLARLELQAGIPNAIDCLTGGLVRMYDNTVPFLIFHPNTTTSSNISGQMIVTQG